MNPRDFYRTAEELIGLPSSLEANYRSSISRSYYSSFLQLQTPILKQASAQLLRGANLSRHVSHDWIISTLLNSNVKEIESIGEKLLDLHDLRKCADYKMTATIEKFDALGGLKQAADLHAAIDSFGLQKIVAYMIQHIRDLANARSGG